MRSLCRLSKGSLLPMEQGHSMYAAGRPAGVLSTSGKTSSADTGRSPASSGPTLDIQTHQGDQTLHSEHEGLHLEGDAEQLEEALVGAPERLPQVPAGCAGHLQGLCQACPQSLPASPTSAQRQVTVPSPRQCLPAAEATTAVSQCWVHWVLLGLCKLTICEGVQASLDPARTAMANVWDLGVGTHRLHSAAIQ